MCVCVLYILKIYIYKGRENANVLCSPEKLCICSQSKIIFFILLFTSLKMLRVSQGFAKLLHSLVKVSKEFEM